MNSPSSFTVVEFHRESLITVEEYSLETKVCVGMMAPVLVLLILFMNWGIVHYEKFGNDPRKRNLSNMMLSSFCMGLGTGHIFVVVFGSIRIIFGPFDASNAFTFLVILKVFLVFNRFCFLEVGIYRGFAAFFPKAIIGINDDWFHCILNLWNLMMAIIISVTINWDIVPWTLLGNHGYILGYVVNFLIGQEQLILHEISHKNTLHIGAVVVADILIILTYVKSRRSSTMQIFPESNQNQPANNVNNQRYNPLLLNHWEILIFSFATTLNITFMLAVFVFPLYDISLESISPIVIIYNGIFLPTILYLLNSKLRQFYLRQFWENAPNFLQPFNPNRIIEINIPDNNIELNPLPRNIYSKKRHVRSRHTKKRLRTRF